MKTGLFFGSFNPIHVGHLLIASYMEQHTDLDEIWLIVSPQNPFKKTADLAPEYHRLKMVELGLKPSPQILASDVEFNLPKPSYTIDTLRFLKEEYPQRSFQLIIGGDNLVSFPKWKSYEEILENFGLLVYLRPGYEKGELAAHPNVHCVDAPMLDISATYIRKQCKAGKSIAYLVPESVRNYISEKNLFQ